MAKTAEQIAAEAVLQFFKTAKEAGFDFGGGTTAGNVNSTTTQKSVTRLTPASARALLEKSRTDAQYTAGITKADVDDFIAKFNAEQDRQIAEVVKSAQTRVTPGASPDAIQREINNILTTDYPSFFKPTEFADNYIWAKVNFGEEKTLGGKAIQALNDVRSIVRGYNASEISDIEIEDAARKIATGKITKEDYAAKVGSQFGANYPQLLERLQSTPGATVRSLASPYINLMAKELELDPESINLDDPDLDKALRPDGVAGKVPMMSLADYKRALRSSPRWEYTTAANEAARSSATGIARALGFGV